jgi:hypothetical protein
MVKRSTSSPRISGMRLLPITHTERDFKADLTFVHETVRLLQNAGISTWLFGGWAEELLGLVPPRPHHGLDLLYPADDFALVDALLVASDDLAEITEKHLLHKRAFARLGIMTELILVRSPPGAGHSTDFSNQTRYQWPDNLLAGAAHGLRLASPEALWQYRADHRVIHRTEQSLRISAT